MSEMIERVAAALMKRMTAIYFDADWESQPDEVKEDWRLNARAAIEAMREPTDGIIQVGSDYMPGAGYAENAWRNMIDECLR